MQMPVTMTSLAGFSVALHGIPHHNNALAMIPISARALCVHVSFGLDPFAHCPSVSKSVKKISEVADNM